MYVKTSEELKYYSFSVLHGLLSAANVFFS